MCSGDIREEDEATTVVSTADIMKMGYKAALKSNDTFQDNLRQRRTSRSIGQVISPERQR